jgi:hypothetical protein
MSNDFFTTFEIDKIIEEDLTTTFSLLWNCYVLKDEPP